MFYNNKVAVTLPSISTVFHTNGLPSFSLTVLLFFKTVYCMNVKNVWVFFTLIVQRKVCWAVFHSYCVQKRAIHLETQIHHGQDYITITLGCFAK